MKSAVTSLFVGAALALSAATASAQMAPPTENKGLKVEPMSQYALGQQGLSDYASRQFRVRRITIEPGGWVAMHSHKDRPGMAFILQGTATEHRDGAEVRAYNPGDLISEPTTVNHWVENRTNQPLVIIGIDLAKE